MGLLFTQGKIDVQKSVGCVSKVINAEVSSRPKDYAPIIKAEAWNAALNVSRLMSEAKNLLTQNFQFFITVEPQYLPCQQPWSIIINKYTPLFLHPTIKMVTSFSNKLPSFKCHGKFKFPVISLENSWNLWTINQKQNIFFLSYSRFRNQRMTSLLKAIPANK